MIKVRILHFLFLLFVLAISGCDTKNEFEDSFKNYFIKYYGENGVQKGVDMIVNDDGSMLLLGNTFDTDGHSQVFLVKVDAEGNIIWQNKLEGIDETAVDIEQAINPGEFVILSNILIGIDAATSLPRHAIKLQTIDANDGKSLTTYVSSLLNDQEGYSVTPIFNLAGSTTPGYRGYMVAGNTSDTHHGIPDLTTDKEDIIYVFFNQDLTGYNWTPSIVIPNQKNGAGVKLFESKTYNASLENQTTYYDRPYYGFGYSDVLTKGEIPDDPTKYDQNFLITPLKENGIQPEYDRYAGDPLQQETMSQTIEDHTVGYISVGTQTNSNSSNSKIVLATSQVDGAGLNFNPEIIVVDETNNLKAVSIALSNQIGSYLILSNETNSTGTTNLWLSNVSIDYNFSNRKKFGKVNWSASFGSVTKEDFAGTVRELKDGKIVILGTIELESQNSKMALIKLNANGEFLN